ncbi:hypothetical protein [Actinoplanes siamensis]|nr:hypothetical protein [Actinoplanes siamensis]
MGNANGNVGHRHDRWSARGLVVVINGILVGVGGVFLATSSVPATMVAAAAAVIVSVALVGSGN